MLRHLYSYLHRTHWKLYSSFHLVEEACSINGNEKSWFVWSLNVTVLHCQGDTRLRVVSPLAHGRSCEKNMRWCTDAGSHVQIGHACRLAHHHTRVKFPRETYFRSCSRVSVAPLSLNRRSDDSKEVGVRLIGKNYHRCVQLNRKNWKAI